MGWQPGKRAAAVLLLAGTLLGGCATGDLVVLLPDASGEVGELAVTSAGKTVTLAEARAATRAGSGEVSSIDEAELQSTFGEALAAEPPVPMSFQLYFLSGTTLLQERSRPVLEEMLAEVGARPVADVQITGHTDRVGTLVDNDRLALQRAERVRDMLVENGLLRPDMVRAVGRGEREPLVPTADEVDEARNRRVQVIVR